MSDEAQSVKRNVSAEVPTKHGKALKLERRDDEVKVTYTGLRTPIVSVEALQEACAAIGLRVDEPPGQ